MAATMSFGNMIDSSAAATAAALGLPNAQQNAHLPLSIAGQPSSAADMMMGPALSAGSMQFAGTPPPNAPSMYNDWTPDMMPGFVPNPPSSLTTPAHSIIPASDFGKCMEYTDPLANDLESTWTQLGASAAFQETIPTAMTAATPATSGSLVAPPQGMLPMGMSLDLTGQVLDGTSFANVQFMPDTQSTLMWQYYMNQMAPSTGLPSDNLSSQLLVSGLSQEQVASSQPWASSAFSDIYAPAQTMVPIPAEPMALEQPAWMGIRMSSTPPDTPAFATQSLYPLTLSQSLPNSPMPMPKHIRHSSADLTQRNPKRVRTSSEPPSKPTKNGTRCLWFSCSATFSDAAQLVPHLTTAHIPANHNRRNLCRWGGNACPDAGQEPFQSTDALVRHLLDRHVKALLDSDGESDSSTSEHGTSLLHVCQWADCAERFSSFSELTEHLSVTHVGARKSAYVCEWKDCTRAGRPFVQRQKCMRHIQVHTGFKPNECNICNKRFSEQSVLSGHMRTHSREKPFFCDFEGCSKRFSILGALTIHRRVHTREKPFACGQCNKRFPESSNLIKHQRTHTRMEDRPFQCPECHRRFTRSDQVSRHLKVHAARKVEAATGQSPAATPNAEAVAMASPAADITGAGLVTSLVVSGAPNSGLTAA